MSTNKTFEFENDDIRFYVEENIAVVYLKSNMFEYLADMEKSQQLLDLFDWIERDPVVGALLIINDREAFSELAYEKFIHSLFKKDKDGNITDAIDGAKKILRARQMNAFRNFIMKMVDYDKLYIACLQNCVTTPFFGASLSADFRFAAKDLKFCLAHAKYGLHPSGALPFYLPRYLTAAKASELLFKCGDIDAEEALRLGLVSEIYPNGDFERHCVEKAKALCKFDHNVIRMTKKLSGGAFKAELEHYFDMESKLIGF